MGAPLPTNRPRGRALPVLAVMSALVIALLGAGRLAGDAPRAGAQDSSGPAPAGDPQLAVVAPVVQAQGWYAEAGAGVDSRTLDRLSRRLRAAGSPWGLVALRQPPAEGTRFFAEDVLDDLRSGQSEIRTVVVLTPTDIAADSRTYDGATLDRAVGEAIPDFERDVSAGYERLFQLLAGSPLTTELADAGSASAPRSGRSTVPVFVAGGALLVVGAVVLVVAANRHAGHRGIDAR